MQGAEGSYVNPLKIPKDLPIYGDDMMFKAAPQGHPVYYQSAMPGQFGAPQGIPPQGQPPHNFNSA